MLNTYDAKNLTFHKVKAIVPILGRRENEKKKGKEKKRRNFATTTGIRMSKAEMMLCWLRVECYMQERSY